MFVCMPNDNCKAAAILLTCTSKGGLHGLDQLSLLSHYDNMRDMCSFVSRVSTRSNVFHQQQSHWSRKLF